MNISISKEGLRYSEEPLDPRKDQKSTAQLQILQLRVQCRKVLMALSFHICCWKNTSFFGVGSTPCLQFQRVGVHTVKQRNDRIRSQELTSQFAGRRQPGLLQKWHESLKTLKPTLGDTTPPTRPHLPKAVVPPRDQVFNPLRQWNHSYSNQHTFRLYFP